MSENTCKVVCESVKVPEVPEPADSLPWNERVVLLSIKPDAARRQDIARLAAELMEANHKLCQIRQLTAALGK